MTQSPGRLSSFVLILTLAKQTWEQWCSGALEGASK